MKQRILPIMILMGLMACYAVVFPFAEVARSPIKKVQARGMILPPLVTKILAFEFKSFAADFLFVRSSQYFGGKLSNREPADKSDLMWLFRNLIVITDLDPYFEDPYYFGNALFTWDVGMYQEADFILKKGTDARTWDWQMPFYLGFNEFYFLHEYKEAADHLLLASRRPGAYEFLPTLAARLYSGEGRTKTAIVFLKSFAENERDGRIKKSYETRIDALRKILVLEQAVSRYRDKTHRTPRNLQVLVQSDLLANIPEDPYGGVFYLDKDGSIKTTSNLAALGKNTRKDGKN